MKFFNLLILFCIFFFITSLPAVCADQVAEDVLFPTHADASIILAKHSGLFERYVSEEASLNDCVAFLNGIGVYFGLMQVVNKDQFTLSDAARVMGQIELVFTGEAEYLAGKVRLPEGIDSWRDFCALNGIGYIEGYRALGEALGVVRELGD